MADYNWNERHIITFPEEKIAAQQKMFMFTMVKMKQSRALICSSRKTKSQL